MSEIQWKKNSVAIRVSREVALMYGLVEPTNAERAEADERTRVYKLRQAESWRIYDEARPALDAIMDPLARSILDLHAADTVEGPRCQGCDMDGYECEAPEWPCRTVEVVAAQFGIPLPRAGDLWRRP